ncbi:hypothetical protein SAMN05444392_10771 [Seinonella peptonophila]|uniref:Uncharacterized protein n=1 Tax=Seinonella peptonophila TaxID=112248 RepID=A0A1M4YQ55_9BACL|nr:hypothetical protein [Seinonella peptonophila]SHF07632.1 hypothetical protein SAMN05444392_10771 [Seinonella peptonophila]
MAVFHELEVTEFPDRRGQTYFVQTGQDYQFGDPEQHTKFLEGCEKYLAVLNEENREVGKKEVTNGPIHTITNEQTNAHGETLLQTKQTTYVHFRAYVDSQDPKLSKEKRAKLQECFGEIGGVPPCPVGSPMTMIIPKQEPPSHESKVTKVRDKLPAIVAQAIDLSTAKLNEQITQRRGRQRAVFGMVSQKSNFAGAGTIQGFGGALNENTALLPVETQLKLAELQERGFVLNELGEDARVWTQDRVIDSYLEQQLALVESEREYLGPIKDPRGNYYILSADHVDKTLEELQDLQEQQRAVGKTKFDQLIDMPLDGRAASLQMARNGQTPRLYVGPGLDRLRERMLDQKMDRVMQLNEFIGQTRGNFANVQEKVKSNWQQSRIAAMESGESQRKAAFLATGQLGKQLLQLGAKKARAKIRFTPKDKIDQVVGKSRGREF